MLEMLFLTLPQLILAILALVVLLVALLFFIFYPGLFILGIGAIIVVAAAWGFVKYRETQPSRHNGHRH